MRFKQNLNKEKLKFTVNHFNAEIIPERILYRVIKRVENEFGYDQVDES